MLQTQTVPQQIQNFPTDTYTSYMVRIWQQGNTPQNACYASVEHVQSGQQWHFQSMKALLDFLETHTNEPVAQYA